jgi:hypothetical protein
MPVLRGAMRILLIWILTGVAAPFVNRGFARVAGRMPNGSFGQSMLLELSTSTSTTLIAVLAEVLTGLTIQSVEFLFMLAAALRLRPAPGSSIVKR